jgi:fructose-bisphosphate aldolase class I
MNRKIDGKFTADFLWEDKGIVPILKVDEGLDSVIDGVQLMKPFSDLKGLMAEAGKKNIFGTKMRSVIKEANPKGIQKIVAQQFEIGQQIFDLGFVPILEPEVDIFSVDKAESEQILKTEILSHLSGLDDDIKLMFKLSIPTVDNFYRELMDDEHVVRVVALSGGYSQSEANERLARNKGLIASFSRALSQGLHANQSEAEFDAMLKDSIKSIYDASVA